jgi:hypothetical protein
VTTPSFAFHDYNRTIIGYHGTDWPTADRLVRGKDFALSENVDDWLGHGVYFWEYAPKQAWWWAKKYKRHEHPAVVGAMIRLGKCFDLLDSANVRELRKFHDVLLEQWRSVGKEIPENGNQHKKLDCAVLNAYYTFQPSIDTCRAVYVPTESKKRVWKRSWIYEETHIQICVRNLANVLAVWHVRSDGRYGQEEREALESPTGPKKSAKEAGEDVEA